MSDPIPTLPPNLSWSQGMNKSRDYGGVWHILAPDTDNIATPLCSVRPFAYGQGTEPPDVSWACDRCVASLNKRLRAKKGRTP